MDSLYGIILELFWNYSLEQAQAAYNFLFALLKDLGLPVSANKLIAPAHCVMYLGIQFDIDAACIRIPHEKLQAIRQLCDHWATKSRVTKHQLQSLLGELL